VAEDNTYAYLLAADHLPRIQSAFVQLDYPWARTPGSARLPGALESPEGVLAGVLARGALLRGAFRSVVNSGLADVHEVFPILDRGAMTLRPPNGLGNSPDWPWVERVSLLGPTAGGLRVLSDVTTSPNVSWRQAGVNRLLSVLIRALRRTGVRVLFEPSSERTWRELVYRVEDLLTRFWEAGALRGAGPREGFQVRCDRTTMTQDDLDNGRLVAVVELDPAAAIERIRVVLTVAEEGVLSLLPEGVS
jgi:phage tail sheath protein FI